MRNVSYEVVKGDKLVITVDLKAARSPSKSGKTAIVASSDGNVDVDGFPGMKMGINIYEPKA